MVGKLGDGTGPGAVGDVAGFTFAGLGYRQDGFNIGFS
jgi:hypothetical protein